MKKPAIIAKLIKDKAIGIINGLTDTINWTTQSMANLKGADGIKIDWGDGSHPTIKLDKEDEEEESGEIDFVGTDGSTAKGNKVTFDNMIGSNVQVNVSDDGNGNVTVKIGVFYL